MKTKIQSLLNSMDVFRRPLVVLIHLGLITLSNQIAFLLRFDGDVPYPQALLRWEMLPWLLLVRAVVFVPFRLYEGLWRYTSLWDLRNIVVGIASSSMIFYILVHQILGERAYSLSIFILDAVLLTCFMSAVRLTRRLYHEMWRCEGRKRVLVYGAGDAGELIVRDMEQGHQQEYHAIGFIDDDKNKVGQRIHGIPVLGTRAELTRIVKEHAPQEVLIAMPTADAVTIRAIVRALDPFKVRITTLPSLRQILDGEVTVSRIRNLAPEDLLGRARIGLDSAPVKRFIQGRRVMVTGAGGSIGSELCRQIAGLGPASLVLFERYENSLFAITNDLNDHGFGAVIVPTVGDVTDQARIDAVLTAHQPDIIFHAAAHKHVPLMEQNPCEAIKNNVIGTRLLVERAERHGVDRFVLISTDKAVNPTSVMGATKRIAELMVQTRSIGSGTSFFAVRFGNVLASNGSVVPRFMDQISAGGPVTITHPDMRRYFMLIPEAVELVLHAASRGETGQIYVLEMGEQVRLVDMARNLIRLSGFVPDEEIAISFVGLRPGEKLEEELVGPGEVAEQSGMETVLRVRPRKLPEPEALAREIAKLERLAVEGQSVQVLAQLRTILPEFVPASAAPAHDRTVIERMSAEVPIAAHARPSGHSCPECGLIALRLSRPQTLVDRVRRSMAESSFWWREHRRLFRCHACGWRGWLVPTETVVSQTSLAPNDSINLNSLDAALARREHRPAFIPRDL